MEELKIIMEALSKLGDGAIVAFIIWCIKEVLVYAVCPLTFFIIGKAAYKMGTEMQKQYIEYEERSDDKRYNR